MKQCMECKWFQRMSPDSGICSYGNQDSYVDMRFTCEHFEKKYMNGYELLGKMMNGEIEEGDRFARVEKVLRYTIIYRGSMFINDYDAKSTNWTIYNLTSKWERVELEEPKPRLDDWEKETCKRLLAKGYKWIARDSCTCLFAYSLKPDKRGSHWDDDNDSVIVFDGFDFITWEDKEPTSIEWLLGRE